MQQAWQDIEKILNEVKPHLLRAGIPERQLTMPDADPVEIRIERYVEIFDWLHALTQSGEWANLLKAWKLRPDHIWEGYKLHEIKGLQEQLILDKAQIAIRKRWKLKRPFFFGRKFRKGNPDGSDSSSDTQPETETATEQNGTREGSAGSGVRSEGTGSAQGHRRRGRESVLHQPGRGIPGNAHRGQHPKRHQSPGSGGGK